MQTIQFTLIKKASQLLVVAFVFLFAQSVQAQTFTPAQIERVVSMYFSDAPEMVEVARCESGMRHYLPDGRVLRGGTGGMMIGLFQLHEGYHRAPAVAMGINIDSLVGNLLYARHLYNQQGATPWRQCVPNGTMAYADDEEQASTQSAPSALTQRLTFGARHLEVAVLQDALASAGYLADAFARGAFDIATMRALVRFQCEKGITCGANSSLAEYGATGERTREALREV